MQPEGTELLESKVDETYKVTLTEEGVYLYSCPPHMMMGVVGVLQVGKATNLATVKEKAPGHARRMF